MMHVLLLAALLGADDKEALDAIDRFKQAYRAPAAPARATAVSELARTPHEKTLKTLAPFLTSDVSTVRIAAAKGMAAFGDFRKMALPILIGAMGPNQKDPDVVAAILESLGKIGDDTTLGVLYRNVEDKDEKVSTAAVAAVGEMKRTTSIEFLIEQIKKNEKVADAGNNGGGGYGAPGIPGGGGDPSRDRAKKMIPAIIKALQAITGEKWSTAKEWQIWWSRKRASFQGGK